MQILDLANAFSQQILVKHLLKETLWWILWGKKTSYPVSQKLTSQKVFTWVGTLIMKKETRAMREWEFQGGEERGFRKPLVNGFLKKTQRPVHEVGASRLKEEWYGNASTGRYSVGLWERAGNSVREEWSCYGGLQHVVTEVASPTRLPDGESQGELYPCPWVT